MFPRNRSHKGEWQVKKLISDVFERSTRLKELFLAQNIHVLEEVVKSLTAALGRGNKVLLFGNGGSAGDSQHLAAEFVNRYMIDRPPLPALALTTDTSIITAISNDFSFEEIFEKQIKALGKPGDIAFGISTSGKSRNVIRGLKIAQEMGLKTIGLGGPASSIMKQHCSHYLSVEGDSTPRIQEIHLIVEHVIVEMVDRMLFGAVKEV